ncbi:MAG: Dabb family protein [Clostridia bacterium]|nr:Dabb family protein [Clostridia bacterium]
MKHYVLLKLTPGTDPVKVQEKLWKAYRKLDDELDWLNHPVVYRSCRDDETGYDVMAVVELDGEEQLETYLTHPMTVKLKEKLKDAVARRSVFNHY